MLKVYEVTPPFALMVKSLLTNIKDKTLTENKMQIF